MVSAPRPIARYDVLVVSALAIQAAFLLLRMETLEEARVIFLFHAVGTVMEVFKTHVGSIPAYWAGSLLAIMAQTLWCLRKSQLAH